MRHPPLALVNEGLWRASSTLTYANATAAVLAPLALMALARAAAEPDRLRWRLAAVVLIVGVGATLSRAGFAALALGILVLLWRRGWQRLAPVALPVLLGAAAATAGVIAAAPDRLPSRPLMAMATLVCGMALSVVRFRHSRHWFRIAAVPCAAVFLFGGATLAHAAGAVSPKRLTVSSPDRADEWNTTLAVVGRHPILGVGPTHLNLTWATRDGHLRYAKATHNEFLQLAAEQGLPALAVTAATLLVIGLALTKRTASDSDGWPAAGALAALAAFVLASSFDFTWHVPLLPIVAAALIGSAFPLSRRSGQATLPGRGAQPAR
jgi:O-antigen ligase